MISEVRNSLKMCDGTRVCFGVSNLKNYHRGVMFHDLIQIDKHVKNFWMGFDLTDFVVT